MASAEDIKKLERRVKRQEKSISEKAEKLPQEMMDGNEETNDHV